MGHEDNLHRAIAKLPGYEPDECLWQQIETRLAEKPLRDALGKLQDYEPDEAIWQTIEGKQTRKAALNFRWLSVAALIAILCGIGVWFPQASGDISYSEEVLDTRLLVDSGDNTDEQYRKLRDYCEAETTVCKSEDFRQLKEEYETLDTVATHLLQAMGKYNTDPQLVRQLSDLEQTKADVLTQMAKLI
jgi:hypothetical protein